MKHQLQKIVDLVEAHLDQALEDGANEGLTLDEIAKHLGFSKYYLNHMFSLYTGHSIMAYVRRKTLEYAVGELKKDKRILDIALDWGYGSERAFSRAVVQAFGHSPTYFRTHSAPQTRRLALYDLKLNVDGNRILSSFSPAFETIRQSVEAKGVELMKQFLSNVHYTKLDAMVVVSGTAVGSDPEEAIMATMNRLAIHFNLEPLRTFGFDSPLDSADDVTTLRGYEVWLSIDEKMLENLPSDQSFEFEGTPILIKRIPAYRYASLRITDPFADPFERIGTGWRYLVTWLEDHDFKEPDFKHCEQANCLEEVKVIEGVTVMDLYVPVDKQ